jgi:hypothetical protein
MTAPNFLISAWAQPVAFFARWKARGVNTLLGAANDTTKEKWEAAAGASGLNFISYPGADVVAEAKQPGRIGFMQPDEARRPLEHPRFDHHRPASGVRAVQAHRVADVPQPAGISV